MKTIHVSLKEHSYDVHIKKGLLSNVSEYINPKKEVVIITDTNIPQKYIDLLDSQLNVKSIYKLIPGESLKDFKEVEFIINNMIKKNIPRSITLIALGGGVIGDLTGFIASVYMRGVDFIQIPTSLLAQVDSSVGGKVGINASHMKNAIGSFHHPKVVLIDPNTLDSLEERHFNNGMAELIKHGLIGGKGLFKDLMEKDAKEHIEDFIYQSITIKKDLVIQDEYDQGVRQILNFGHTIGHAIEQDSKYDVLHGEAIAIGMTMMAKNQEYYNQLVSLFNKYSLPTSYKYSLDSIYEYIKTDKKIKANLLNLVVVEEVGKGFIKPIEIKDIRKYL